MTTRIVHEEVTEVTTDKAPKYQLTPDRFRTDMDSLVTGWVWGAVISTTIIGIALLIAWLVG